MLDKYRDIVCQCGNTITYMTLNNTLKCQKCGAVLNVIPCQPEDFLEEEEETPVEE